jgi:hypothetical protein
MIPIAPKNSPHSPTFDQETSIVFYGEWDSMLSIKIQEAWFSSIAMEHKLPDWIRYMEGASGKKYRYFINNLIENMSNDVRYLEIGTWSGSTTCSATYGNKVKCHAVDNWKEFGGPKDLFFENINNVKLETPDLHFEFTEASFQDIDFSTIGTYNVYMYDGSHNEIDQYHGISLVLPALDDTFIFICDDWNWEKVRKGTMSAINDQNLTIINSIEIRTLQQEVTWAPDILAAHSDWHNGYFIALIKKTEQ